MKKRFTRILGVGVTVAMLASMLVGVVPAAAVSQPQVAVAAGQNVISQINANYTVTFIISNQALTTGDSVTLTLPSDTVVAAPTATIAASPGWTTPTTWGNSVTGNGAWSFSAAARTITYTLAGADVIGGTAAVSVDVTAGITNPTTAGDYTLTVTTTNETAATSAAYAIANPVIPAVPGIVQGFNASDIKLTEATGAGAVLAALATAGVVKVVLGPGTYDEGAAIVLGAGQTLTSSGGAAATIISDANASGGAGEGSVTVGGATAVLDGLTVTGGTLVTVAGGTVKNSVLSNAGGDALTTGVNATSSGNTISASAGNNGLTVTAGTVTSTGDTFTTAATGTAINNSGTLTVTGATITGASGTGVTSAVAGASTTITGSSLSGLNIAINVVDGAVNANTNTIDNSGNATTPTAAIYVAASTAAAGVRITANTITGGPEDILEVDANANNVFANFNTLTGNTGSFDNDDAVNTLDARNNWWGDATGPAVASQGLVNTTPFLIAPTSNPTVAVAATSLTGQATAGVNVATFGTAGTPPATPTAATLIAVANYDTNPASGAPPADSKKFFDVYISDVPGAIAQATLTFFGVQGTGARVWAWSGTQSTWVLASVQTVDLFQGAVVVQVTNTSIPNLGNLAGLEFVLTEPSIAPLGAPAVLTPAFGDDDAKLKPTFTWTAVAGATGYEFVLAEEIGQDNKFSIIDYSASTPTNGHVARETLKYGTVYNWRARAVRDSEKGPWVTSFFTTMVEPEPEAEPIPPVIIEPTPPAPPAPEITLTVPPGPAPVQAVPETLLYVIIAVGAVLVIAVIILIVRTRRVA